MANYDNMNYIANQLLKKGWHKNSITASLICAMQESGFDPKINNSSEAHNGFNYYPGGNWGWGLWQWSYLPNNKKIADYVKNHNAKESIDYEITILINNNPVQWQGVRYSWSSFMHNTQGLSVEQLTKDWFQFWEGQGSPEARPSLFSLYWRWHNDVLKHLKWNGNSKPNDGTHADGNNSDKPSATVS